MPRLYRHDDKGVVVRISSALVLGTFRTFFLEGIFICKDFSNVGIFLMLGLKVLAVSIAKPKLGSAKCSLSVYS